MSPNDRAIHGDVANPGQLVPTRIRNQPRFEVKDETMQWRNEPSWEVERIRVNRGTMQFNS